MSEHVFDEKTFATLQEKVVSIKALTTAERNVLERLRSDIQTISELVGILQKEDSTTLEQFFRNHYGKAIDFRIRVEYTLGDKTQFYIHPMDVNGQTLTFEVEGNTLKLLTQVQ